MKDHYKILNLNKNASEDEVKIAYKKLAMKYHPDRNPNNPQAEDKFKEIKEAYEFIINKNNISDDGNFQNFNMDFDISKENINFSDFIYNESSIDDIFKIIFQKNYKKNSYNNFFNKIISIINIDIEQSIYGSIIPLRMHHSGICKLCLGKGSKLNSSSKICFKCNGSGLYTISQGLFNIKQKCFKCLGKGYLNVDLCVNCFGKGKINRIITFLTKIKPGSDNNVLASLHLLKEYKDFINNENYAIIKIKPHPVFYRRSFNNNNIYSKYFIDFIKISLGGFIKIYTLYGSIKYKLYKNIKSDDFLFIKNKGLNYFKFKNIGDLYLKFYIEISFNLSNYQKFLLKKLKFNFFNKNFLFLNKFKLLKNYFYKNILFF